MTRQFERQISVGRILSQATFLFLLLAFAIRTIVILQTRFLYDDAFITFQYAHNLARGAGLVYQAGERVLGTTSPFYAVLLAVFEAAGIPSPLAAQWLNLFLDAITLILLVKWAGKEATCPSWTKALLTMGFGLEMLSPIGIEAGNGGMESALFRLLLILFWMSLKRKRPFRVFGLSVLLSATRPEGPLYAILILFVDILATSFKSKRVEWFDNFLIFFAIAAGSSTEWALVALIYGGALPVSVSAKLSYASLLLKSGETAFTAKDVPLRFFGALSGILAGVLYVYGLGWIWKKEPALLSLIVIPAFYFPALARADVIAHPWYYLPPLAFYFGGVAAGLIRLIEAPSRRSVLIFGAHFAILYPLFQGFADGALPGVLWVMPVLAFFNSAILVVVSVALAVLMKDPRLWQGLANGASAFFVAWILLSFWKGKPIAGMAQYAISYRETNRALAEWVSSEYPGAILAIGEIGYAGYGLPIRILDLVGLVQPEVARVRATAAKAHPEEAGLPEVLAHFKPDFVALETHLLPSAPLPRHPYFNENYQKIKHFSSRTGRSLTLFAARK